LDIFSIVEIEFVQGKNKKTATDAVALERFKNIIRSPKRFETANRIAVLMEELLNGHEKDEKLSSLLSETFRILNEDAFKKDHCDILYFYFAWKFFDLMGFLPQLYQCAACSEKLNPQDIYFSCKAGGVVCRKCSKCEKNIKGITADFVKILRLICKENWQTVCRLRISSASKKDLLEITDSYCFYLADK
jgi:DNA repair protein RecO (recombination protein O)